MQRGLLLVFAWLAAALPGLGQVVPDPLVFDGLHKQVTVRSGQTNAVVTFLVTNRSSAPVVIRDVVPSCGCSVASFPAKPWTLAPGGRGEISVATDVRGKSGSLLKTVLVQTASGPARQLTYSNSLSR